MTTADLSAPDLSALDAAKAEDAAAYKAFLAAREVVFDALRGSNDDPKVVRAILALCRAGDALSNASYKAGIEMGKDIYGGGR